MKKAIIAMSGGVDSSVAAHLTIEKGYQCIGATMKLFTGREEDSTCCSLSDIKDAKAVAHRLGMEHFVFNFTDDFDEKVIKKFINAYEIGATPNPCIECNRYLKFEKLIRRMEELEYDYVVTGHYARIEERDGRFLLKKAVDETKDQSYVLYSMTQKQLAHTLFPLGELTKEKLDILRQADFIFRDEMAKAKLDRKAQQFFAVMTNVKSVGVRNNARTFGYVIAIFLFQPLL